MQRYHEYRDGCEPDDDGEWVYYDEAMATLATRDAEIAELREKQRIDEEQCDRVTSEAGRMAVEIASLRTRLSAAEADAKYQRDVANRADHRRVIAEAERDAALESAREANGKREWAERERDEAVKVAVWAARHGAHMMVDPFSGRDEVEWVEGDALLSSEADGTDADLYRALREAKEMRGGEE